MKSIRLLIMTTVALVLTGYSVMADDCSGCDDYVDGCFAGCQIGDMNCFCGCQNNYCICLDAHGCTGCIPCAN